MTNLDSVLKSRDITLLTKVHLVKAMVFPLVMYGCESWTIKEAERPRINAFEVCCWRRLLRVPWTARRSNQSILKEINLEYSSERLMLKLKCQYFVHLMGRTDSMEKTLMLGKIRAGGKGGDRGKMVGWHHKLSGHEFEQTPRHSVGQGSLACLQSMGSQRVGHDWLNNNKSNKKDFPGGTVNKNPPANAGDTALIPS